MVRGNSSSHGTINNVPVFQIWSRDNLAVICDPIVGDIGLVRESPIATSLP